MSSTDPVPSYFSFRYIAWVAWSNAITIMAMLQAIFQAITLDPTLLPHEVVHWATIVSLILTIIVAQMKKNNPPGESPRKVSNGGNGAPLVSTKEEGK